MEKLSGQIAQNLADLSLVIRKSVFETLKNAESGHPGGNSSSVELLACLYFGGILRFDPNNVQNENRDRVLIRGHEGPVRYKIFSLMGLFSEDELKRYRQLGSILQGHEDMYLTPGVDITPSGSLGMGLSYGIGSAISAKENRLNYRTFVFLGDGEEQEGNVSEAARHATNLGLDNLICIIDKNGKQLSHSTEESDSNSNLKKIWEGYGWNVLEIKDGHNINEIMSVYSQLENINKPTFIIAHTIKGKGITGAEENYCGYHTLSTCPQELMDSAISDLYKEIEPRKLIIEQTIAIAPTLIRKPDNLTPIEKPKLLPMVNIKPGSNNLSTLIKSQEYYFEKLSEVQRETSSTIYFLTPDFIRKDLVERMHLKDFTHFIDTGIKEQHLIAMAHGLSVSDPKSRIFIDIGDAFIYRAIDQLYAATQGDSKMIILGEQSGLTQSRNGKTHQTSGQPGALMNIPGLIFKEPADIQDFYNILNWSFEKNPGIVYLRLHRKNIYPLYRESKDQFNIHSYTTHSSDKKPQLVIASSGFTTHNSVEAAKTLESQYGIPTKVINIIGTNQLDDDFVRLLENDTPLLTVYNGSGKVLHSMVSSAILESNLSRPSIVKSLGFDFGTSGTTEELERYYQLDQEGIVKQSLNILSNI